MVESQPSKLLVASSILVSRSIFSRTSKAASFTPYSVFLSLLPNAHSQKLRMQSHPHLIRR